MSDAKKQAGPALLEVPVDAIDPSPYQRRKHFAPEAEQEMAESMREHGVLQPLLVRPAAGDRWELMAGERRLRAARLAGLETVPAFSRPLDDRAAAEVCCIENLQREDLDLIEEAESLQVLVDFGISQAEIAARIGKSRAFVFQRLNLLNLDDPARAAVVEKRLSMHAARTLLQVPEARRAEAFEALEKRGMAEGELPERQAVQLLAWNFIEPARQAARWEEAREEVLAAMPGATWCGWEEAAGAASRGSGFVDGAHRPPRHLLAIPGEAVPTWGELARRHGVPVLLAAVVASEEEEELAEGEKQVAGFLVWEVLEAGLVVDAVRACHEGFATVQEGIALREEALAEGLENAEEVQAELAELKRQRGQLLELGADEPCPFKGAKVRESEEGKREAAEEAHLRRELQEKRAKEMRKVVEELLAGRLSVKKEAALAVFACAEISKSSDLAETVFSELLGEMRADLQDEAWQEELERIDRKMAAMIRRPEGGMAALGRLLVAHQLEGWKRGRPRALEVLAEHKVVTAKGTPALHALLEERQQEEGKTLQETC